MKVNLFQEGGGLSWEEISRMYGGSYNEYLDIITNYLVMNTNLDIQLISQLIGQSQELDKSLAKNGNIKYNHDFIEKILNISPLWLLNNKNLNPIQYREIVDYYTNDLVTFPPEERERFGKLVVDLWGGKKGSQLLAPMVAKDDVWSF